MSEQELNNQDSLDTGAPSSPGGTEPVSSIASEPEETQQPANEKSEKEKNAEALSEKWGHFVEMGYRIDGSVRSFRGSYEVVSNRINTMSELATGAVARNQRLPVEALRNNVRIIRSVFEGVHSTIPNLDSSRRLYSEILDCSLTPDKIADMVLNPEQYLVKLKERGYVKADREFLAQQIREVIDTVMSERGQFKNWSQSLRDRLGVPTVWKSLGRSDIIRQLLEKHTDLNALYIRNRLACKGSIEENHRYSTSLKQEIEEMLLRMFKNEDDEEYIQEAEVGS